jgi:hypothetical protein
MPNKKVSQKFYDAALRKILSMAEKHLRNYKVQEDYYKDRVNKEANILKQERLLR